MKCLALLILLLSPELLAAQAVDVRGFGGMMMNTRTDHPGFTTDKLMSGVNAGGGIGASYRCGRLEFGIKLDYRSYSFIRSNTALIFSNEFNPQTGFPNPKNPPVEKTVIRKEPALAIAPVFNYHFGKSKLDWYTGLSPAFIRYTGVASTDRSFKASQGANGWSVEAQVGAACHVLPRLKAFAEVSGGYVRIPYFGRNETGLWAAGLNIGAQFRVWENATAAPAAVE